jgi:acetyl-CoA synthetase
MHHDVHAPSPEIARGARIKSQEEYQALYELSIRDNEGFWGQMGLRTIDWFRPFTAVRHGAVEDGDVAWYVNGQLNGAYNTSINDVLSSLCH